MTLGHDLAGRCGKQRWRQRVTKRRTSLEDRHLITIAAVPAAGIKEDYDSKRITEQNTSSISSSSAVVWPNAELLAPRPKAPVGLQGLAG